MNELPNEAFAGNAPNDQNAGQQQPMMMPPMAMGGMTQQMQQMMMVQQQMAAGQAQMMGGMPAEQMQMMQQQMMGGMPDPMGGQQFGGGMGQQRQPQSEEQQIEFIKQRYRTQKCKFMEQYNNCNRGELCQFAHHDSELRQSEDDMPPELVQIAMQSVAQSNMNQNSRGGGGFGNNRGGGGRGGFRGGGGGGYQRGGGYQQNGGGRGGYQQPQQNFGGQMGGGRGGFQQNYQGGGRSQNSQYKTKMCRSVQNGQPCSYGDKCQYAHSEQELSMSPQQQQQY